MLGAARAGSYTHDSPLTTYEHTSMQTRCALVGMPGSGKSTVGRQLARRLGLPFVDLDQELELRLGCSISSYFEQHGEPAFREHEAALLAELLDESEDVAAFTAWDNKEYYHYKPQMSSLYAGILSTANNRMVQVASVVRDSSRDYPRPVPLEIFEYPPFLFEAEALQQCLRDMAETGEYADIRFTESSVGTVYLYSTRYLDEDYAAFLAEKEDVGAIASP